MKKLSIIMLAALTVGAISCKKVLDVSSYTSITDATAFESADRCLLALNGVYDAAQSGNYQGGTEKRGYPFGAANIEQGDARGEDVINIAAFYQITYQATYNGTSANNVAMWDNAYALINKANVSIDGFKGAGTKGVITAATATQYEAECRFLRAMAHHEVVIHYARPYSDGSGNKVGIPYREVAVNSSTAVNELRNTPRMRVDSVYMKILQDLDFAETNLPALQSGVAAVSTYRATKAAAIALKMRVKMHMGDWAGVITEGNKLVPASGALVSPIGAWTLTTAADGPFTNNTSKENVFSIKNDALDAPSVNGGLAYMLGATGLGGRGLVAVSPILWNNSAAWKCDDKRRTLLYISGGNANGSVSMLTTKYRDYVNRSDYAPQIRYAEVLLTLAEAEARQASGVSARAVSLLNAVRDRALANPVTDTYTVASFADKVALTKAILMERRIEFLFEGKRWADIHRLATDATYGTGGIPAKAVNGAAGASIYNCGVAYTPGQAAIPYSDFRFIWPIPADEVTQNPIVSQNPGY